MFVGDEHTGEIFRGAPNSRKALSDLAERKAGVNQDADLIGFEVSTIAG